MKLTPRSQPIAQKNAQADELFDSIGTYFSRFSPQDLLSIQGEIYPCERDRTTWGYDQVEKCKDKY